MRKQFGALSSKIPVDDPQAALEFCRALSEVLQHEWPATGAGGAEEAVLPHSGRFRSVPEGEEVSGQSAGPEVSIVVPVYNEEENILPLYEQLRQTLEDQRVSFEIVFINDGSTDTSMARLSELVRRDARISVLELARNFGHQVAISAGIDFARGSAVILMDADMQDSPKAIPQFIKHWRAGYQVVYAIRTKRKEGSAKRLAYRVFYRLLKAIAKVDIPLDAGDFCLMDRRAAKVISSMPERNRFVRGIRSWIGLRQIGIEVEREARHAGAPKYSLSDLVVLAIDGLVSFSFTPLRLISFAGFTVSLFSLLLAVFYAVKKITLGLYPPGFATTVVLLSFFAGVQLVTIGVIGEYVGRIFEEVKKRPLYVLQAVHGQRFSDAAGQSTARAPLEM